MSGKQNYLCIGGCLHGEWLLYTGRRNVQVDEPIRTNNTNPESPDAVCAAQHIYSLISLTPEISIWVPFTYDWTSAVTQMYHCLLRTFANPDAGTSLLDAPWIKLNRIDSKDRHALAELIYMKGGWPHGYDAFIADGIGSGWFVKRPTDPVAREREEAKYNITVEYYWSYLLWKSTCQRL